MRSFLRHTVLRHGMAAWLAATAGTAGATVPVVADFEAGYPPRWFLYGDFANVTLTTQRLTVGAADALARPGQSGDEKVLAVTADVATWGGMGLQMTDADWTGFDALAFWFRGGGTGGSFEVEINTRSGGRHRAEVVDEVSGWRRVVLPFTAFRKSNGSTFSEADLASVTQWALILDGFREDFLLDQVELGNRVPFADFEGGVPDGWFVYREGEHIEVDFSTPLVGEGDPGARPFQLGDENVLAVTADVPTWAGIGGAFDPPADWSRMEGVAFWFRGTNSGAEHEIEIRTVGGGDRRAAFRDEVAGWRLIALPFGMFVGEGSLIDLARVGAWVLVLDGTSGTFEIDELAVFGDAVKTGLEIDLSVEFSPEGVRVRGVGAPGRTHRIESSGDPAASDWTVLGSVVADGEGSFEVESGALPPRRFFRGVLP